MMIKSLILLVLGGSLFTLAVRRLRQYKLRERYALVFLLLGLPFAVLAAWPNAFELLTIVSLQDQKITTLAQCVGILMEKQKLAEPEHTPGLESGPERPRVASR